ncbi:MAG: two-component sensor histidine kinase [Betaproteobacteria bacterium RIFCSPLOWO2_02_FULL_65_24]|nr:MAG: two-component sensor histidine kinase [Betaproteobacteria bacterium RIFCSPLOWO2_02_FULL_65_24]
MRPRSITLRLTLLFSTISTIVLIVVSNVIGFVVERRFEQDQLSELRAEVELVSYLLSRVRSSGDLHDFTRRLSEAVVGHHNLVLAVAGSDGRLLYSSPGALFPAALLKTPAGGEPVVWEQGEQTYRGIAAAAATGIAGEAPATVAVALDIRAHRDFMATFRTHLWLTTFFGALLTALLGWFAARRGIAPVHRIAKLAGGISAAHLNDRLALDTVPEELTDLARALNDMLARLEEAFRRLSDFSSHLAHELRTPISNLMTETQVALTRGRSADEYREVLYSSLEEYDRLARMIEDMLFLAKADHGLIVPHSETVDLAGEAREAIGIYAHVAEDKGVGLGVTGEGRIKGDKLMIRRALCNLLSNAIRHTPREGRVQILIGRPDSKEPSLVVENTGEDIPAEHLPRLFDRFYRVSRSRDKSGDGAGLGLAITKSIVESHNGTIQAFSSNGWTRFEIRFASAADPGRPRTRREGYVSERAA